MSDVVCCLLAAPGFDRAAQGVLGAGRRLADSLGGKLRAVVVGPADEALNGGRRCRGRYAWAWPTIRCWPSITPSSTLTALAAACKPLAPQAVLLGNDTYSQELAARLAHRLGGSAAGDAVEVAAAGDTRARDARRVRRQGHGRDRTEALAGRRLGARAGHGAGRRQRAQCRGEVEPSRRSIWRPTSA